MNQRPAVRRLCLAWLVVSLSGLALGACAAPEPSPNPLIEIAPEVLLDEEGIVLLRWDLEDRDAFRAPAPSGLGHLEAWRAEIEQVVDGTGPLELLRQNRERYPWLEEEHPVVRRINERVEKGELGRHRPMNGLEAFLLDFHASRYPLFERPSELGALLLVRETGAGARWRIYYLTDGDGTPPKNGVGQMLERIAEDREAGWDVRGLFHNHTFDLESEKGMLAVAAPSESDLQLFRNLGSTQEWEHAWVTDGFHTLELDAAELSGGSEGQE